MSASKYREPTLSEIEIEAQELRIYSGFKLTLDQARDRIAESHGWVGYSHCCKCKKIRGAQ